MHDNTKLLLLIFSILTIGTVAIILSLRPTKNTEAFKKLIAGSPCKKDTDCKSHGCGYFDDKKYCCSMKENWLKNDYHWEWDGEKKICTKLGKGSDCSYPWQCNSHSKYGYKACWDNKCL